MVGVPLLTRAVLKDAHAFLSEDIFQKPRFRFQRSQRIVRTDEFSSVFNFRRRFEGAYFQLYYRPNDAGQARLGVVVGKKWLRRAHDRNAVKRLVREHFRLLQHRLSSVDLVVRLAKPAVRLPLSVLKTDIDTLFLRIQS